MDIEYHPLANCFPLMSAEEFEALKADIRQNGLRDPISIFDNKIIDGRNRYRACLALHVRPNFETLAGLTLEQAMALSVSRNLQRRHLSKSQQAMCLVKSGLLKAKTNPGDKRAYRTGTDSIRLVGRRYGVSHVSIYKAIFVFEHNKRLADMVLSGKLSVVKAESQIRASTPPTAARLPPERRVDAEDGLKVIASLTKIIEKMRAVSRRMQKLPPGARRQFSAAQAGIKAVMSDFQRFFTPGPRGNAKSMLLE